MLKFNEKQARGELINVSGEGHGRQTDVPALSATGERAVRVGQASN